MAISKANFNSFNVTPTASKFITFNSSNNGLAADDIGGSLKLLSTQTASNSASLTFTSGIDSTHKEYIFKLINIHPASDNAELEINFSVDSGSNYNVAKTTTAFRAYHAEDGAGGDLGYQTSLDQAQGTAFQVIAGNVGNDADECVTGTLQLFNPSSTTFVKHFLLRTVDTLYNNIGLADIFVAGYFNTTTAITRVRFKMSSGNFDGIIKLYGVT